MNKIVHIGLYTMIFLFAGSRAFSQTSKNQCLELVRSYHEQIKKLGKPAEGKVYFVDFQQEVSYWDASVSTQNQRIKYYVSNKQVHLITDDICTYTDENYVFTVLNSQKKILVTRNPESEGGTDKTLLETFLKNQTFVIEKSQLVECAEVTGKGWTKVVLDAANIQIQGLNIDKLTYFFDNRTGQLKKTVTTYDRGYKIRRMSITYNDFQTNYKYNFPKNLMDMFLDAAGNLKPKYRGYELITN